MEREKNSAMPLHATKNSCTQIYISVWLELWLKISKRNIQKEKNIEEKSELNDKNDAWAKKKKKIKM